MTISIRTFPLVKLSLSVLSMFYTKTFLYLSKRSGISLLHTEQAIFSSCQRQVFLFPIGWVLKDAAPL